MHVFFSRTVEVFEALTIYLLSIYLSNYRFLFLHSFLFFWHSYGLNHIIKTEIYSVMSFKFVSIQILYFIFVHSFTDILHWPFSNDMLYTRPHQDTHTHYIYIQRSLISSWAKCIYQAAHFKSNTMARMFLCIQMQWKWFSAVCLVDWLNLFNSINNSNSYRMKFKPF